MLSIFVILTCFIKTTIHIHIHKILYKNVFLVTMFGGKLLSHCFFVVEISYNYLLLFNCSPYMYFFNGRSILGVKQIHHIHQYIMHLIVLLMTDGILVRNFIFYLYKIALNKEKLMI